MDATELQLRLLTNKVEVIEAQVNHECNRAVDAVNDMARRIHDMMEEINTNNRANIEQVISDKFIEVGEAVNQLYSQVLILEDTIDAFIKLNLVEDLSDDDRTALVAIIETFLKRDIKEV